MNLTEVRQAIADIFTTLDENLTVDIYTPSTVNIPHAWVKIDTIEPQVFGSRASTVTGSVTVIVSGSTDDQADELLDAWLSDHTIVDAFADAEVQVAALRFVQVGDEFQVAGQGFVGFVCEFEAFV